MQTGINLVTLEECGKIMGPQRLREFLGSFSCPLNAEVEHYLTDLSKAYQSSLMSSSVTYLVLDAKTGDLLGYFTLMMKAYSVRAIDLNSRNRRLVTRFSEIDASGNVSAGVYLIAQIGKNFAVKKSRQIAGAALLELAMDQFRKTRKTIGGKLVMVERESDRPKLLDFYTQNGFKSWTTRRNANDGMVYDQMFAILGD